jgi:alanine-alpha-ketoisovalerate/valine-pyruvate aminotransferase
MSARASSPPDSPDSPNSPGGTVVIADEAADLETDLSTDLSIYLAIFSAWGTKFPGVVHEP